MYWPRFRLTKAEAQKWCAYSAPGNHLKPVLYRAYAGELQLSTTNKEDTENLQISRRARVFAFTCSGDVNNIEVNIYDSIGEQYTMGFVPVSNLMLGTNPDFRGMPVFNGPSDARGGAVPEGVFPYGIFYGDTQAPHIFEPNISLDPNQTLSVKGRTMRGLTNSTFFPAPDPPRTFAETAVLSFVLHVWEFPVE